MADRFVSQGYSLKKKQTRDLYRDLSVSRRSIIFLGLRLWQIVDLLTTDKSQYFAQLLPIIVNYFLVYTKTVDRVFLLFDWLLTQDIQCC